MIGAILWGRLSDRFGRKAFFVIGLLFLAVGNALMGVAPNLFVLCISRSIAGFGGGTESVANAAIADLVPPHLRSKYLG
jgi:MFS family permease